MTDEVVPSCFSWAANLKAPSPAGSGFGLGAGGESTFLRHAGQTRPTMGRTRVEQCGQSTSADMEVSVDRYFFFLLMSQSMSEWMFKPILVML
jgi:hypothetical protein